MLNKYMGLIISLFSLGACAQVVHQQKFTIKGDYPSFTYQGNDIYAGAMNLAWTELSQSIIKAPIRLDSADSQVQAQVYNYNHPVFTAKDIESNSYYVKSGRGQSIVDTINQEVKVKFPHKKLADLQLKLGKDDVLAYAYLAKAVQYQTPFAQTVMNFSGKKVKAMSATTAAMRANLALLDYHDNNDFVLRLRLKEPTEELYLIKGHDQASIKEIVSLIKTHGQEAALQNSDHFKVPFLSLLAKNTHPDLVGKRFLNQGFENNVIGVMIENIQFQMDEIGASVENDAVISMVSMSAPSAQQPKDLIFDRPYWLVMKMKNAVTPYLVIHVRNSQLMKLVSTAQ